MRHPAHGTKRPSYLAATRTRWEEDARRNRSARFSASRYVGLAYASGTRHAAGPQMRTGMSFERRDCRRRDQRQELNRFRNETAARTWRGPRRAVCARWGALEQRTTSVLRSSCCDPARVADIQVEEPVFPGVPAAHACAVGWRVVRPERRFERRAGARDDVTNHERGWGNPATGPARGISTHVNSDSKRRPLASIDHGGQLRGRHRSYLPSSLG